LGWKKIKDERLKIKGERGEEGETTKGKRRVKR
jgi:hypothetical protein